ncbi:hypothetical protein D7X74_30030 [Corallococcus sp. CA047B]|uniref:hypothetical protein n=1 Tax=Corallococcus sp. CA047B TaxID=2316729 RepID=UPI000EA28776|nr:hypothetical protein [Corallococcus sp. CA047B]RKH09200.1 hypothetical protein D7X74_30030 [Corallococcus sp. CA047B]
MSKRMQWLAGLGLLWMSAGCGPMEPGEESAPSAPSVPEVTAASVEECRNACAVGYVRCGILCNSGPFSNPTCKPRCTAEMETCFNLCAP